jgi:hypothetical protein
LVITFAVGTFGIPAPDVAALLIIARARLTVVTLHERVFAAELLELRARHQLGMTEQQLFIGRRRHAHHRADL